MSARIERLLVIDARIPTPLRDGGSLRLTSLMRVLVEDGRTVTLVPSFTDSFPPFSDSLQEDTRTLLKSGVEVPTREDGKVEEVDEHLERVGRDYDLIWICGAYVASRHYPQVRSLAPQAVVVFDTIDLHFIREFREAKASGNVNRLRNALKVKQVELAVAKGAEFVLTVSAREKRILEEEISGVRCRVIPNIHSLEPPGPGFAARGDLMYLGAFTFSPNIDAVLYFTKEVMPALTKELPGVKLFVVGADPTPEIRALDSENVTVTGFVPELRQYFNRTRVAVHPLRFGAGIKGKLLLSLSHGLPCVASTIAVEGIPLVDGRDVLLAESEADWVEKTALLYRDRELWHSLSRNGRRVIDDHYSPRVVRQLLLELLMEIESGDFPRGA